MVLIDIKVQYEHACYFRVEARLSLDAESLLKVNQMHSEM